VVAQSLLEKLPGDSLAAKSSTFMVGASIAAFLVSKEIYIVDAEFFEMLCLFGAYYVWYSNGKEVAAQYFKDKQQVFVAHVVYPTSIGTSQSRSQSCGTRANGSYWKDVKHCSTY
jgi:hypothetical protein